MDRQKTALFFLKIAFIVFVIFSSCSSQKEFSIHGTVQSTDPGKDGYTAHLITDQGEEFDAVISRVGLGEKYKELNAGDEVTLSGDTTHLGAKLSVRVNAIK